MDEHIDASSVNPGGQPAGDEAKAKFDAFMSLNVEPFEEWGGKEEEIGSSEDEEWNPPSEDSLLASSDSDSDGSQIQDAFLASADTETPHNLQASAAIIATRTRARAPLTNVLISDLEGMLQPESDAHFHEPLYASGEIAHPHMLQQFSMNGHDDDYDLSPSESASHREAGWDDENSPLSQSPSSTPTGFEYPHDPVELERQQQSYAQFLQTMHGQGDIPAEVGEDDLEYHIDPDSMEAVPPDWYDLVGKISRAEVEELLRDGRGEGEPGQSPSSSHYGDPHSGSTSSSHASRVEYVELTTPQRNLLHQQVLQLFQLQLQVYLISRHIEGYSHIAETIWKQYNHFVALSTSATMSYRAPASHLAQTIPTLSASPVQVAIASTSTQTQDPSSLMVPGASTHAVPGGFLNRQTLSPREVHSPSPLHTPSDTNQSHIISANMDTLQVPGVVTGMISVPSPRPMASDPGTISISMNSSTSQPAPKAPAKATGKKSGGKQQQVVQTSPTKREAPKPFLASVLALPTVALMHQESMARLHLLEGVLSKTDFKRYIDAYASFFRENLAPKVDARATMSAMTTLSTVGGQTGMMVSTGTTTRYKWTPAEDELLALGFENFHKNWNLIHLRLLPCKDVGSIATRFKNKTSKKSKENPIKTALVENTKPLTSHERDLLTLGVSQMGQNFELIAATFLPSRKPLFLARLWRQMTAASKKSKHSSHSREHRSSRSSSRRTRNRSGSASSTSSSDSFTSSSSSSSSSSGSDGAEQDQHELETASHDPSISHPQPHHYATHSDQHTYQRQHHHHQAHSERQRGSPSGSAANSDNEAESVPVFQHSVSGPYGTLEGQREDLTSSRSRNMALARAEEQQQAHGEHRLHPGHHHYHHHHHHHHNRGRGRSGSSLSSSSSEGAGSDLESGSAFLGEDAGSSSFDSHIIESGHGSSEDEAASLGEGGLTSSHDSDGVMDPPGMMKKRKLNEDGDVGQGYSHSHHSHHAHHQNQHHHQHHHHHGHHHEHETTAAGVSEELLSAPFKASNYLDQLLKWEEIWQEEAVVQAIAAAEASAVAKSTGKPKNTAKSKKHSKAKKDDPANIFGNEWDHELWLTPPPTPSSSNAAGEGVQMEYGDQNMFDPSSSAMPQPTLHIDSTHVHDGLIATSSGLSQFERMMVDAETDQVENQLRMSAYAPLAAPPSLDHMSSQAPAVLQDRHHVQQQQQQQQQQLYMGEIPTQHFVTGQPPHQPMHVTSNPPQHHPHMMASYPEPHLPTMETGQQTHRPLKSSSSSTPDPEFILMQKNLEKEVKHAQTTKTSGGKSAAKGGAGAGNGHHHIQPSSVPPFASGMFSVLTPEGRVITSGSTYSDESQHSRGS